MKTIDGFKYECLGYCCPEWDQNHDMQPVHIPLCVAYNDRKNEFAKVTHNDFDAYGAWTKTRWFSKGETEINGEHNLAIMSLGIAGEAGEVAEKMKKVIRDGTIDKPAILKELGDVVFYVCMIADYFGFTPSQILAANVDKIEGRAQRGTQRGSGDNR